MKNKIAFFFLIVSIQFSAQKIYRFAGTGVKGYSGDGGQALLAELGDTKGKTYDVYENLIFIDNDYVRKIDEFGVITTITGIGPGFSGDGGQASQALLNTPIGIATDAIGIIYITDRGNSRIRRINLGGVITTICGTGINGFSGDGGLATSAQINYPSGICVDKFGNIIFSDWSNNRIRKIDTSGIISTIAGTGVSGFSGDGGPAITAQLFAPSGITTDSIGNVYFVDYGNVRVRKISTSGLISTIAGNGLVGSSGDGGWATSAKIATSDLCFDKAGNLFLAENYSRVRVIYPSGIINTLAGTGIAGNSGDGGPANIASLMQVTGITTDSKGNVYFGQTGLGSGFQTIRVVCLTSCLAGIEEETTDNAIMIYPNPTSTSFRIKFNEQFTSGKIALFNSIGQKIYDAKISKEDISVLYFAKGLYHYVLSENGVAIKTGKLIID